MTKQIFQNDQEYIDVVLKDERFPDKIFYWAVGEKAKKEHFRVDKQEVICDYTNSKGEQMQFYSYFISPKDFIPYLIFGSRFL